MRIERCECLIDSNIYDSVKKYTKKEIDKFPYYKKDIYNKKEKVATLVIDGRMNFCILSFIFGTKTITKMIEKVSELCGVYSLYYNDIIYCVRVDKDTLLNGETFLSRFHIYHWKSKRGDMEFVKSLTQYTDISNKLEMSLLLYCLIFNMEKVKLDINLMEYIEEKFSYYGYDINDKISYKINFEEKLNTYFSLENELPLNSNAYYEMFYELFKYLWNLETIIDIEKYSEIDFYKNIMIYFGNFIGLLTNEGIIP